MNKRINNGHEVPYYRRSLEQRLFKLLLHAAGGYLIGLLFYDKVWIGAALAVAGTFAMDRRSAERFVRTRQRLLSIQFEQALQSMISSLHAGRSVENALRCAADDLRMMYSQHSPYMAEELDRASRMAEHGIALESALEELARRLGIPDITDWADVFKTCKRTGGDLLAVMRNTSRAISEKMDMERELTALIAGKRFEANMLSVVPLLMIAALRFGSPDYLAPLYEGTGRIIMTAVLTVFAGSVYFARRLMRFEW